MRVWVGEMVAGSDNPVIKRFATFHLGRGDELEIEFNINYKQFLTGGN